MKLEQNTWLSHKPTNQPTKQPKS